MVILPSVPMFVITSRFGENGDNAATIDSVVLAAQIAKRAHPRTWLLDGPVIASTDVNQLK